MAKDRPERTRGGDAGGPGDTGSVPPEEVTADRVRAYLDDNPDFFLDFPDLLDRMTPPSRDFAADGDAEIVDLQQYMLRQTRAKAATLEGQLSEIVGLAREGMHGHARIRSAILTIVGARSLDHLIEVVTTDLAVILDLDAVLLAVEAGKVPRLTADGVRVMPDGMIDKLMGDGDVVLQENIAGDRHLYGSSAGLVRSQALIRLAIAKGGPPALLAMGVRRPDEFAASQGTDLLSFLGDVLSLSLRNWLDIPG